MLKRINSTEPENNVAAENSSLTPPSSQPDLSGTITDETVAQSSNVKRVKSYATPLDTAPYFPPIWPERKDLSQIQFQTLKDKSVNEIEFLYQIFNSKDKNLFKMVFMIYMDLESFGLLNKENEAMIKNHIAHLPFIFNMMKNLYIFFASSPSRNGERTCYIIDSEFYNPGMNAYIAVHKWWSTLKSDFAEWDQEIIDLITTTIASMSNSKHIDLKQQITLLSEIPNITKFGKYVDMDPIKLISTSLQKDMERARTDEDLSQIIALQDQLYQFLLNFYPKADPAAQYNFSSRLNPA